MTEPAISEVIPGDQITPGQWSEAACLLTRMLKDGKGVVSSLALRCALEKQGFTNARQLVVRLKYYDFDSTSEELAKPEVRWFSHAKSIYSKAQ